MWYQHPVSKYCPQPSPAFQTTKELVLGDDEKTEIKRGNMRLIRLLTRGTAAEFREEIAKKDRDQLLKRFTLIHRMEASGELQKQLHFFSKITKSDLIAMNVRG